MYQAERLCARGQGAEEGVTSRETRKTETEIETEQACDKACPQLHPPGAHASMEGSHSRQAEKAATTAALRQRRSRRAAGAAAQRSARTRCSSVGHEQPPGLAGCPLPNACMARAQASCSA